VIIVRTPLRISFLGGGTDFDDFYLNHGGAVLSTTIDKSVFVIVNKRFDDLVYVNYSTKEIVEKYDRVEHDLVREAMRISGIEKGIEITTLADVPAEGTGLGSSSSITVGLLNALHTYRGETKTAEKLAQEACHIEVDILRKPIGKQDQYIAAYGGIRLITFEKNSIKLEKIELQPKDKEWLNDALLLFNTGIKRRSARILSDQKNNINQSLAILGEVKNLAFKARGALLEGAFDDFGSIIHQGWILKKKFASGISNTEIDDIYETARKAGVIGGKITGAGGGGYLLLYCPDKKKDNVRRALHGLQELPFCLEETGSSVIFNYR